MRGTTNQAAGRLEPEEKDLGGQTLGYQGQVTVLPGYLDWEFEFRNRVY